MAAISLRPTGVGWVMLAPALAVYLLFAVVASPLLTLWLNWRRKELAPIR